MRVKKLFIACIGCFVISCNSNNDQKAAVKNETIPDTVTVIHNSADSTRTIINRSIIWNVINEGSGKEKLTKPENVKLDTFSSSQLIQLINENFTDIHLDLVKISQDTIYVKIPKAKN